MSQTTAVDFSVRKSVVKVHRAQLHNYAVDFSDPERMKGYAIVHYIPLIDCSNIILAASSLLSLQSRDIVADLRHFYPNGSALSKSLLGEQYMRKGVGSAVLERILDDAKDVGAKGMFVFSGSPSLRSFLLKKEFMWPISDSKAQFYLPF